MIKKLIALYMFLKAVVLQANTRIAKSYLVRNQYGAMNSAGSFIMLYIAVFIGSIFALSLLTNFVTFCTQASWAFNGSDYETIFDILLNFILPMLWVLLALMGLAGSSYGVWRIASRL